MAPTPSILTSVKKVLNIAEADEAFDQDIILFINGTFATLNQMGIGPELGFSIDDKNATWDTFLGTDPRMNNVKTYVYLQARVFFDPPQTSFHLDAMQRQITELGWRINVYREETAWVDPTPDVDTDDDFTLDGGSP